MVLGTPRGKVIQFALLGILIAGKLYFGICSRDEMVSTLFYKSFSYFTGMQPTGYNDILNSKSHMMRTDYTFIILKGEFWKMSYTFKIKYLTYKECKCVYRALQVIIQWMLAHLVLSPSVYTYLFLPPLLSPSACLCSPTTAGDKEWSYCYCL